MSKQRRPFNKANMDYWLRKARKIRRAVDQMEIENPSPSSSFPGDPMGSGKDWAPIPGTEHIGLVGRFVSVALGRCDVSGDLLKGQS